jgi:hypothetical protein
LICYTDANKTQLGTWTNPSGDSFECSQSNNSCFLNKSPTCPSVYPSGTPSAPGDICDSQGNKIASGYDCVAMESVWQRHCIGNQADLLTVTFDEAKPQNCTNTRVK